MLALMSVKKWYSTQLTEGNYFSFSEKQFCSNYENLILNEPVIPTSQYLAYGNTQTCILSGMHKNVLTCIVYSCKKKKKWGGGEGRTAT